MDMTVINMFHKAQRQTGCNRNRVSVTKGEHGPWRSLWSKVLRHTTWRPQLTSFFRISLFVYLPDLLYSKENYIHNMYGLYYECPSRHHKAYTQKLQLFIRARVWVSWAWAWAWGVAFRCSPMDITGWREKIVTKDLITVDRGRMPKLVITFMVKVPCSGYHRLAASVGHGCKVWIRTVNYS